MGISLGLACKAFSREEKVGLTIQKLTTKMQNYRLEVRARTAHFTLTAPKIGCKTHGPRAVQPEILTRWVNPCCRESDLSLKRAYGLCQRMMHFFHQYLLHVTFEVLEPLWLTLQKGVQSATSLDEVRPEPVNPNS